MIQVIGRQSDGRFYVGTTEGPFEWPAELKEGLAWVDVEAPTPAELEWLGRQFHFHPLALEDCSHFDQRPKVEEYADHLFIVIHGLISRGPRLELYELHSFLASNLVVTVHDEKVEPIEEFKRKLLKDRHPLPKSADFLLHEILDQVVDAYPASLRELSDGIDSLDRSLIEIGTRRSRNRFLETVHSLQQQLRAARHVVEPLQGIFQALMECRYHRISTEAGPYYRDLFDHSVVMLKRINAAREELSSIRDTFLSLSAHRTNESIKRLTVFSVVFLPLTFLTGVFGMNFAHMPWDSELAMLLTLAGFVLLPLATLLALRKKRWI